MCVKLMMELSGVRSSCDMFAGNCDFSQLACSPAVPPRPRSSAPLPAAPAADSSSAAACGRHLRDHLVEGPCQQAQLIVRRDGNGGGEIAGRRPMSASNQRRDRGRRVLAHMIMLTSASKKKTAMIASVERMVVSVP